MQKHKILLLLICCLIIPKSQSQALTLHVIKPNLANTYYKTIFLNGNLTEDYNDTILENILVCKSGNLAILQNNEINGLLLQYSGVSPIQQNQTQAFQTPNQSPVPQLLLQAGNIIQIKFNCPAVVNNFNYFNKFEFIIRDWRFSFLVNCDPGVRHKNFQYGYLFISIINAIIIIGVAMHSRVWSIRIKNKPLRIQLSWERFLIILIFLIILGSALVFVSQDESDIFILLKYVGICLGSFFGLLCLNEIFYLVPKFRKQIFCCNFIRICEILSLLFGAGITFLAIHQQNWILFNVLAGFICVGSIKVFHFNSLRQAYFSMGLTVATFTTMASIFHFVLDRSYNDEAAQLSSPLFIQVPDLINNLFKKCSWLPVIDVIVPGVLLSYLRIYDSNQGAKYIGVYTIVGNFAFISSTALWILIQLVYPFSVPFSLVTYSLLALTIFLVSWRRNEWKTLYNGTFVKIDDDILQSMALNEKGQSFQKLLSEDFSEVKRHTLDANTSLVYQKR